MQVQKCLDLVHKMSSWFEKFNEDGNIIRFITIMNKLSRRIKKSNIHSYNRNKFWHIIFGKLKDIMVTVNILDLQVENVNIYCFQTCYP